MGRMGLMVLVMALAILAHGAEAATVYGNLRRANLTSPTTRITFTPTNSPFMNTNEQVIVSEQFFTSPTNGLFSTLCEQGYYVVNFGASMRDTKRIYVPAGDGSYDFWTLIYTNGPTFAAEIPGGPVFGATNVVGASDAVGAFKRKNGSVLEFYKFTGAGGATVELVGESNIVITASAGTTGDILDDDTGEDILDGH